MKKNTLNCVEFMRELRDKQNKRIEQNPVEFYNTLNTIDEKYVHLIRDK